MTRRPLSPRPAPAGAPCSRLPRRRRSLARALSGAAVALAALGPASAGAQQAGYTADRLILAPNPDDGFAIARPVLGEKTRFFGDLTLDYIRTPLRMSQITKDGAVLGKLPRGLLTNQANAYFAGGGEFLHIFSLAVVVPLTFVNTGNDPNHVKSDLTQGINLNSVAAGDLRFDARALIFKTDSGKFRSAIGASLFAGSGNAISFAGDGGSHSHVQVLLEERAGPFIVAENLGVHFRPKHDIGPGQGGLHFGDELTFGVGVFLPVRDGKLRIGAEFYGSTGIGSVDDLQGGQVNTTFRSKYTPLEWLGEVRGALDKERHAWLSGGAGTLLIPGYSAPDFRLIAQIGYWFELPDTNPASPAQRYKIAPDERVPDKDPDSDGDGIPDSLDKCPTVPEDHQGTNPADGCPEPKDRDHDGIPDDVDKCPDEPEDRDGFEDADGCPDPDNDKDGIPDVEDACPKEPGPRTSDPKTNGCPQFIRKIEGSNEIQILKRIEFDTGKATIKPGSFPILDEVFKLLQANPGIHKVSIEGHTDDRGAHDMNKKLSQDRAQSCVTYLVQKGISPERLTSAGFGPDKPIDDNKTNDGRQKNRRVEFHITDGQ